MERGHFRRSEIANNTDNCFDASRSQSQSRGGRGSRWSLQVYACCIGDQGPNPCVYVRLARRGTVAFLFRPSGCRPRCTHFLSYWLSFVALRFHPQKLYAAYAPLNLFMTQSGLQLLHLHCPAETAWCLRSDSGLANPQSGSPLCSQSRPS